MEQLSQQVAKIAAQLQQEGKEPSLALVKARLGIATMSPALLQAYQAWRNGVVSVPNTAEPLSEQPSDLQADLARIEAKLDLIIKKLGI
ncbi:hypothetical protein [Rheinheimera soli]|jgi:hypothetical protein|uniref:KfrA N-terminal DNA-binding domain-containing protein n=1 Tax=Rheinheimera soli TaxID=443616 RepID=A0ABU1W500_9GAMM|nr:hypothetical protein [Rheinheimera soli]MDR7122778.1 hypothetical protein [Rheinheimera soli]